MRDELFLAYFFSCKISSSEKPKDLCTISPGSVRSRKSKPLGLGRSKWTFTMSKPSFSRSALWVVTILFTVE